MQLLALVCGSLLLNTQPKQADSITFSCPGATVENALKQLSEATSLKLDASKELQGLPLIVCVKEMKLQALFDAIADCLSARWNENDNRWTLVPDSFKIRTRTEVANRRMIASLAQQLSVSFNEGALQRNIDSTVERLAKAAKATSSDEQNEFLSGGWELPVNYFSRRILGAVDPRDIANLMPGSRMVYSTKPTRAQRPFTHDMIRLLQKQEDLNRSFQRRLDAAGFKPSLILDAGMRRYFEERFKPVEPISGGTLIIVHPEYGGSVTAYFRDSSGRQGHETSINHDMRADNETIRDRSLIRQKILSRIPSTAKFDFSDRALLMARAVRPDPSVMKMTSGQNSTRFERSLATYRKFSAQDLQDWASPDRVDPTNWYVGEVIAKLAEYADLDVIASPADRCLNDMANVLGRSPIQAGSLIPSLVSYTINVLPDLLHLDGNTLILRQDMTNGVFSAQAVNRKSLAKVMPAIIVVPFLSVDHCRMLGWTNMYQTPLWMGWLQAGTPVQISQTYLNIPMIDLSRSLSETQLRAASSAQGLQISSLLPEQRSALHQIVYGASTQEIQNVPLNVQRDVTDVFENGVPTEAVLLINSRKTLTTLGWSVLDEIGVKGSFAMFGSNPQIIAELESYKSFMPFYSENITLQIKFGDWLWRTAPMQADSGLSGPPVDSWQKLPAEYTAAIRKIAVGN
ncbi:MAG: hypothetical protein KF784_02175 [Fimbriimonadaceae bacterium]|nr:hypothetical protein [Fimbriimonadaceae bacterium]